MSARNARGLIEPVVYFENKEGYVIIAPDSRHPTPESFERRECRYLHEVDKLARRVNQQDKDGWKKLNDRDRRLFFSRRQKIRANLIARKYSAACRPVERMFIDIMLRKMDEREEKLYGQKVEGFFHAREFDGHDPHVEKATIPLLQPEKAFRAIFK